MQAEPVLPVAFRTPPRQSQMQAGTAMRAGSKAFPRIAE
jgi:hypothetical protein